MDIFPKFIIEDGHLIIGKVSFHTDLVKDKTKVKGGGWFKWSPDKLTMIFYGDSHDLGRASFEDIKKCVEDGKVCDRKKERIIIDRYNFGYDTGTETIQLNKPVKEETKND